MPKRDYIAIARQYTQDVLDGTIPTCKLTRLAVQRQVDDLARAENNDPTFPYVFDEDAASKVCRFVELHPFNDGARAGQLIVLSPWQVWELTTVWGWLQKFTGQRRFRRAYTEVAKGNGKSAMTSPLCDYMAFGAGVKGAQVFAAGASKDQARVVFDVSCAMMRKMPFMTKAGIQASGKTLHPESLYQMSTNSSYRPLSSESADNKEGLKPVFISMDELHAHKTRDLFDNLSTANGKMPGSLLWIITTAGTNRASVCYEQHQLIVEILEGTKKDETTFGLIYSIDPEDSPWDETTWRKANPNWGVSVDPEEIAAKANLAKQTPSLQNAFLTKNLDVWCNADISGLPMRDYELCFTPHMDIEDFRDDDCIIGVDAATRRDLASIVAAFRRWEDERWHYYAFQKSWLPEKAVEESPVAQLKGWVIEGHLETRPGVSIDLAKVIPEYLEEFANKYNVKEIALDPHKSEIIVPTLQEMFGEDKIVTVSPKGHEMCPAMKEFETLLVERRFHHDGDPLYAWACGNVGGHVSQRDSSVFPVRKSADAKIDPAIATMIALRRWTAYVDEHDSGPLVSVLTW